MKTFFSFVIILMMFPFTIWAAQPLPFNLTYPTVTKTLKLKQQNYDKLDVYIKGKGYQSFYGQTWEQGFKYPKFSNNTHQKAVRDFVAKSIKIKSSDISKDNFAHFYKGDKEYWLKLSIYTTSYSYLLLQVTDYPKAVTLDSNAKYAYTKKYKKRFGEVPFANNIAIPHVKDYTINRVVYKSYDEKTFYYDRKGHLHKGKFWQIDFSKITKDKNSQRYSIAHDYKAKMLKTGATILKDEDNTLHFKLENNSVINIIKFGGGNSSFSITIIQEEPFKQSLVLTPDSIKTQLDKEGKITLDGIYFDFNKATLKPESNKAILSTVALMQSYPDLVLAVHGHTDSKGSDTYNMTLSANRAASVRNAIIAQGIESERLQSKGYGESEPIVSNDTEKGRAQNRRVELHKVSGGDKKSIITIDFIKPLENSVVDSRITYQKGSLGVQYSKPYSQKHEYKEFAGHLEVIRYNIIKDGKMDESISRKEMIKNYANILELYNAKLLGEYSNTLYFKIKDRGNGASVFGSIAAYTGSYTISFLIQK